VRIAYFFAWLLLAAVIAFLALARRSNDIREWIVRSGLDAIAATFLKAGPLDYAKIALGIKTPVLCYPC
jgi:hypothetical protein